MSSKAKIGLLVAVHVIGGLLMATFVTLFMVPVVYAILRRKLPTKHLIDKRFQAEEHEGAS